MKTAILQLEPYDNQYSIRDRMEWSHAKRILLVWPKRARLINSELELRFLLRQAQNMGAQIALICREDRVISYAKALKIPVFSSVTGAESSRWGMIAKPIELIPDVNNLRLLQEKKIELKKGKSKEALLIVSRFAGIILGFIAILGLIIFLIPSAKITIFPQMQTKQINISIWASPQVHEINLNGNLPAVEKQIEVSGELTGESNGVTNIPISYASGEVTFTNLTNSPVTVPQGTIISTSSDAEIRFATIADVIVPSGVENTALEGVKALQAGASGNLTAGELNVLEGSLGAEIDVSNDLPLSGGSDEQAPSPTEEDYRIVQNELLSQLRQQVINEFSNIDEQLILNTLDNGKIVSEERSLDPGQPGDQFNLTITSNFTGLVYSQANLVTLANQAMAASLDVSETNYSRTVVLQPYNAANVVVSSDGASWQQSVTATVGPAIDKNAFSQLIAGKKIDEAEKLIKENIPSRKNPIIAIYPFNVNWLPFAGYQIQIQAQ